MIPVTLSGTITDAASGVDAGSVTFSVQDEYGAVQPSGAVAVGAGGQYSFTISLQASRRDTDRDGRRYTVTIRATDKAGNVATASAIVVVPHDRRR
jgi:type 1 fimbria pilin